MNTHVVASGKGGTGKTTVAALFALLAAETGPVVVADCDVEASNLPLALGSITTGVESFHGGAVAIIDPSGCRGCGLCAQVCRYGAIHAPDLDSETLIPSLAYTVDPLACEGCGACTQVSCPNMAIRLEPTSVGDVLTGKGGTGVIVSGRLEPGKDLSGRLVTEVRSAAARSADEQGADLVLVDGPPGVGCPFLSSMADADGLVAVTEPSVSGAHDLERLLDAASQFGMGVRVVLNKCDLSSAGAEVLRSLCADRGVRIVSEVPFDDTLARLPYLTAGSDGVLDVRDLASGSPGVAAVVRAWEELGLRRAG